MKQLEELRMKKSEDGSTCLITLYIPEGKVITDFTQQLVDEMGTAANIKSKTTRKNVQAALQVAMGILKKLPHKAPKNGLVLFVGVTEGSKMENYLINPTSPIEKKMYICDNRFHTDHLEENMLEKKTYGLLTIDSGFATVAVLIGTRLEILRSMTSGAPKKHRKGGQSAVRFARIREIAIEDFIKRVADEMKELFIESQKYQIEGLIIGGPGILKERLIRENFLDPRLLNKVIKVFDISYASDKQGMYELVEHAKEVLAGIRYVEEKALVQKWLDHVYRDTGLGTYGEQEVRTLLEQGAVDLLLMSSKVEKYRMTLRCQQCQHLIYNTIEKKDLESFTASLQGMKCPNCSSSLIVIDGKKDLIEELGEFAEASGAKVEIISPDTEEGQELLHFTGIAAILRYKATTY